MSNRKKLSEKEIKEALEAARRLDNLSMRRVLRRINTVLGLYSNPAVEIYSTNGHTPQAIEPYKYKVFIMSRRAGNRAVGFVIFTTRNGGVILEMPEEKDLAKKASDLINQNVEPWATTEIGSD